jgi:hypothetical protein
MPIAPGFGFALLRSPLFDLALTNQIELILP